MPPQQQYYQSSNNDPYAFITGSPQGGAPYRGGGRSVGKILAIVIGGGIILAIAIVIIFGLLLGGNDATTQLVSLAKKQNEIARVASIGVKSATSQRTKNVAIGTQLSIQTDQQTLLKYLASKKAQPKSKELEESKNTKIDTQLNSAISSSTFDATFLQVIETQLTAYQSEIVKANKATTSKTAKAGLQDSYETAGLLLEQVKQAK
jgi:hypothetical protein